MVYEHDAAALASAISRASARPGLCHRACRVDRLRPSGAQQWPTFGYIDLHEAFHSDPSLVGACELFTQKTSAEAILAAFRRAAASTAELVWFSFSGHAVVTSTGELRLLLPEWCSHSSDEDKRRFSIGAQELEGVLRSRLASKKFLVILDTCYSGAFGGGAVTRDVLRPIEERIMSAGAVVISSCTRDQLAVDGHVGRADLNGAFTHAIIEVLKDHARSRSALSVLDLFREVKANLTNGQVPTLYANGLTDDFAIFTEAARARLEPIPEGISCVPLEVPTKLKDELMEFLESVVEICKRGRVGLFHAERQLASLSNEFYKYRDNTFVVSGTTPTPSKRSKTHASPRRHSRSCQGQDSSGGGRRRLLRAHRVARGVQGPSAR